MEQSDLIIVVLTGVSVLFGLNRGFCTEILGLAVYIFSGVLGYAFAPFFSSVFASVPFEPARRAAAVLLATFVVWLVLKLLTGSLIRAVRKSSLNGLDRSLGGVFGFARAAFFVLLITVVLIFCAPQKVESGKILQFSSVWVKKIPELDFSKEETEDSADKEAPVNWKKRVLHYLQNKTVETDDGERKLLSAVSAAAADRFAETVNQADEDGKLSKEQRKFLAAEIFEMQLVAWLNDEPLTQEEIKAKFQKKMLEKIKEESSKNENSGD